MVSTHTSLERNPLRYEWSGFVKLDDGNVEGQKQKMPFEGAGIHAKLSSAEGAFDFRFADPPGRCRRSSRAGLAVGCVQHKNEATANVPKNSGCFRRVKTKAHELLRNSALLKPRSALQVAANRFSHAVYPCVQCPPHCVQRAVQPYAKTDA